MKTIKFIVNFLIFILFPYLTFGNIEVIGKKIFKLNVNKGDNYTLVLKVRNAGNNLQETILLIRDYLPDSTGVFYYSEQGSHKRSNAKWIQTSTQKLFLAPQETCNITLQIRIPDSELLHGTYWSEITFKSIDANYTLNQRWMEHNEYAQTSVQIVTNIGNTGKGILEFNETKITVIKDEFFIEFFLSNNGDRLIRPNVSVELFDNSTGLSATIIKSYKICIYPGAVISYRFPLADIQKEKKYEAYLIAEDIGEDIFGKVFTLNFPVL